MAWDRNLASRPVMGAAIFGAAEATAWEERRNGGCWEKGAVTLLKVTALHLNLVNDWCMAI